MLSDPLFPLSWLPALAQQQPNSPSQQILPLSPLEKLVDLLLRLWAAFSQGVEHLLGALHPNIDKIGQFDETLLWLIKISTAVLLLLALSYLFWYVLNRIIKLLQKIVIGVVILWAVFIIVFFIRGF